MIRFRKFWFYFHIVFRVYIYICIIVEYCDSFKDILGTVHLRRQQISGHFWPLPPQVYFIGRQQNTKEGVLIPP